MALVFFHSITKPGDFVAYSSVVTPQLRHLPPSIALPTKKLGVL